MSADGAGPTITVNGETQPYCDQSLEDLIAACGIDPNRRGIAAALNSRVVPRAEWPSTRLSPGDEIELVRPLAGGCGGPEGMTPCPTS